MGSTNIFSQSPENSHEESMITYGGVANHLANISTIAILTSDHEAPLDLFVLELANVLKSHGSVQRLNSHIIKKRLGEAAMDSNNEYRLTTWLGQQEDVHRMTVYQCDSTLSPWTRRCLRQADCILIVAMGDSAPKIGKG
jgi:lysophospholipid hydrolase